MVGKRSLIRNNNSVYWWIILYCIVLFIFAALISCSSDEADDIGPPKKETEESVKAEKIAIPFNYKVKDTRPHLTPESYSDAQSDSVNRVFDAYVAKAKTTRGKVVSAAMFSAAMNYVIPYGFSMKDRYDNVYAGYDYAGLYNKKGLFLKSIEYNGYLQPAWGYMVKKVEGTRTNVKNLGDYYPNGLNCSSFVGWCLVNGGVATSAELYKTYSNHYRVYPNSVAVLLSKGYMDIRPGDLLWFEGHIVIVVGVEGDDVIYVSAEGGGDAAYPGHGIRYKVFNRKTTDYANFMYKYLIQMTGVYKD